MTKHNCPTDQFFDAKLGKCVNNSEHETVDTDSSTRDKSSSNLKFPKRIGGKKLGLS